MAKIEIKSQVAIRNEGPSPIRVEYVVDYNHPECKIMGTHTPDVIAPGFAVVLINLPPEVSYRIVEIKNEV